MWGVRGREAGGGGQKERVGDGGGRGGVTSDGTTFQSQPPE